MTTIWGVEHGVSENCRFSGSVLPSPELIKSINDLPNGSLVGIEPLPVNEYGKVTSEVNNSPILVGTLYETQLSPRQRIIFDPSYKEYFKEIIDVCNEKEHNIVHLEDRKTFMDYVRVSAEIGYLSKIKYFERRNLDIEKMYFTKCVDLNYLYAIKRSKEILKKINSSNLDLVIVGGGHSDSFVRKKLLKNMSIDNYRREKLEMVNELEENEYDLTSYIPVTIEVPRIDLPHFLETDSDGIVLSEELIIRKKRSISKGRITTEKPDYIGTWDMAIRARGLFELFIEKRNGEIIEGRIEDTFGTAHFNGFVNEKNLLLTKKYDSKKSDKDAYYQPLIYKADLVGEQYKGSYFDEDSSRQLGMFKMRKFTT